MVIKHNIRSNGNGKSKVVKLTALKAIRFHCIECMGFNKSYISECSSTMCALYPFRMGKNPSRGKG